MNRTVIVRCLALLLGLGPGLVRGEGVVTTPTTTALLQALLGGGTVTLRFSETLTLENPIFIAADTILVGDAPGGRLATLSGGGRYRLFHVLPGIRFEVRNCVLREGVSTNGGAILNEGILVADSVTFAACVASGPSGVDGEAGKSEFGFGRDGSDGTPGGPAYGGAIYNRGEATLNGCVFNANQAKGGSGGKGGNGGTGSIRQGSGGAGGEGAAAYGGAIASMGPLSVNNSLFTANSASGGDGGAGGGSSSTNAVGTGHGGAGADAVGGAIFSHGWLQVIQSSFATNLVAGGDSANAGNALINIGRNGADGGNAYGGAVAAWSAGAIINTTFFTNLAVGGAGGAGAAGTFTVGWGGDGGDALGAALQVRGELGVTNVTFAWNAATNAPGGAGGSGAIIDKNGEPGLAEGSAVACDGGSGPTIVNSILAGHRISTVYGEVRDMGYNLFTDDGTGSAVAGSRYGTDPVLGEYRVWTQGQPGLLPLSGSPAVDVADPARTPRADQRGLPRPGGGGSDIGALEVGVVTFYIAGQVLDGTNGLAGVGVSIGSDFRRTDEAGAFRFGPLASGIYTVSLENGGLGFTPRLVQIPLVADATNVVFRTAPLTLGYAWGQPGVLVLNGSGGIPGRVYRLEGGPDLRNWGTWQSATADAQGRVVFELTPGPVPSWFYRLVSP